MKHIKAFLRSAEAKVAVMASAVLVALSGNASAALDETMKQSFTDGFTSMATDATAMIAAIVPIAIGVAGTIFLVKKAMGWFKGIAGK